MSRTDRGNIISSIVPVSSILYCCFPGKYNLEHPDPDIRRGGGLLHRLNLKYAGGEGTVKRPAEPSIVIVVVAAVVYCCCFLAYPWSGHVMSYTGFNVHTD